MNDKPIILPAAPVALSAEKKRVRRFTMLAYTGGELRLPNFRLPVVVDLSSLQSLDRKRPVLRDHNQSRIVGHAERMFVDNAGLRAEGVVSGAGPDAAEVLETNDAQFPWEVSIGATPGQLETIKGNERVNVNGREFTGPLLVARNAVVRELSFVAVGADPNTAARIAAQRKAMETEIENPVVANIESIRRLCRVDSIRGGRRELQHFAEIEAQAIEGGWDEQRVAVAVNAAELEQIRAERPQINNRRQGSIGAPGRDVITAALMMHGGRSDLADKTYGAATAQRAVDLRCHSLLDICAAALRTDMADVPADTGEMIRAAFSTTSLPNALGAFADRSAADAFRETPAVWTRIARRRSVKNFREHKIVRLLLAGNLEALAADGQIKHGVLTDTARGVSLTTKARMLGLTRQDVLNDDLNLFSDISQALGRAAARSLNDDFVTAVLGNAGAFFSTANGNYATTGSALNATSLSAALASMAKQTDSEGSAVDVRARVLLVPPELEFTARQLLNSIELERYVSSTADLRPSGNPFSHLQLTVEVEPRLSNAGFAGFSTSGWYLFALPVDGAVNVALLNGRDTPVVEQADEAFNMLGVQYRAYLDAGFALGEPVAAYRATGAA